MRHPQIVRIMLGLSAFLGFFLLLTLPSPRIASPIALAFEAALLLVCLLCIVAAIAVVRAPSLARRMAAVAGLYGVVMMAWGGWHMVRLLPQPDGISALLPLIFWCLLMAAGVSLWRRGVGPAASVPQYSTNESSG